MSEQREQDLLGKLECEHDRYLTEWRRAENAEAERVAAVLSEQAEVIRRHQADEQVTLLREALIWYLADDDRRVDEGVLESVDMRPAYAALAATKEPPSQEVQE